MGRSRAASHTGRRKRPISGRERGNGIKPTTQQQAANQFFVIFGFFPSNPQLNRLARWARQINFRMRKINSFGRDIDLHLCLLSSLILCSEPSLLFRAKKKVQAGEAAKREHHTRLESENALLEVPGGGRAVASTPTALERDLKNTLFHLMSFKHSTQRCGSYHADVFSLAPEDSATSSSSSAAGPLILFIPGNPGLPAYYEPFLKHLYAGLQGQAVIASISQLEHCPTSAVRRSSTRSAAPACPSLDEQIQSKADFIRSMQRQHPGRPTFVIGHSLGGWMTVQVSLSRSSV